MKPALKVHVLLVMSVSLAFHVACVKTESSRSASETTQVSETYPPVPSDKVWKGEYIPDPIPTSPIPFATDFHRAVRRGDHELVRAMLDKHPEVVDIYSGDYKTPLHLAAGGNHVEVAEVLIRHGVDVNAEDGSGSTPLHDAVGHSAVVIELLLAYGAEVDPVNRDGHTPLQILVMQCRNRAIDLMERAEMLVAAGADVNAGWNARLGGNLQTARNNRCEGLARFLERNGAMERMR